MNPAQAVALWNELEQKLIRIGLPQDGRLLRLRAELVRTIGESDNDPRPHETSSKRPSVRTRHAKEERVRHPPNSLGPDDGSSRAARGRRGERRNDLSREGFSEEITAEVVRHATSIYDARWAAMIERACSGKSGYSGDDEVSYEDDHAR